MTESGVPFLRTKPSTTGVTLAMVLPTSMTRADPLPAAKLKGLEMRCSSSLLHVRVQDACVGNVKRRHFKLFEHHLSHALPVCLGIPSGFCAKNGVFCWVAKHHFIESMIYKFFDRFKIVD